MQSKSSSLLTRDAKLYSALTRTNSALTGCFFPLDICPPVQSALFESRISVWSRSRDQGKCFIDIDKMSCIDQDSDINTTSIKQEGHVSSDDSDFDEWMLEGFEGDQSIKKEESKIKSEFALTFDAFKAPARKISLDGDLDSETSSSVMKRILKEAEVTDEVGSLCKYLCFTCKKEYRSWSGLKKHLNSISSHGPMRSRLRHMTEKFCHKCRLCSKRVLSELVDLRAHMKTSHGLKLENYVKDASSNSSGKGGKQDDVQIVSGNHKRITDSSKEKAYRERRDALMKSVPIYKTQTRYFAPPSAIPDDKSTPHLGNLCQFRCLSCANRPNFPSWSSLVHHSQEAHGRTAMGFNPVNVSEARFHTCRLCRARVLCDNYFVARHLHKAHRRTEKGMDLARYQDLVREEGFKCLELTNRRKAKNKGTETKRKRVIESSSE